MMKVKLMKKGSFLIGKPQTEILLEADSIELMEQLVKMIKNNFNV